MLLVYICLYYNNYTMSAIHEGRDLSKILASAGKNITKLIMF